MNIQQLYNDYSITFVTEGHKHSSIGWCHTVCPFCTGHFGYHLGYNEQENYFNCWRCGAHHIDETLSALLNISKRDAQKLIKQYSENTIINKTKPKIQLQPFKLPSNLSDFGLPEQHRKYIIKRNFDPDKLQKEWDIRAAGVFSRLGNIDFKHRLIMPIYWGNEIVSFLSRDITDKHLQKYLVCPTVREVINIKKTLYGKQDKWNDSIIVVEGVFDVWRLGVQSTAVYGIKFTPSQVRLLAKFKKVVVMFDNDSQGIVQSKKLVAELKFRGVDSFRVDIADDPANLSQSEADYLVKQLI